MTTEDGAQKTEPLSSSTGDAREAVATAPWFSRLACRLLQERAAGDESEWCLYLALLPVQVSGSPLSDAAMMEAMKRYPPLYEEAQALLASVHKAHALLQSTSGGRAALCGADREEFTAACGSRSRVRSPLTSAPLPGHAEGHARAES